MGALLAGVLLIASIVFVAHYHEQPAQAAQGNDPPAAGAIGQPQPSSSDSEVLASSPPGTAPTTFNVNPDFASKGGMLAGPAEDNTGDSFGISLTTSLNGFTLYVKIGASYNASQYTAGTSASVLTGQSCMDIKGPTTQNGMAGETYTEPPIDTSLTDSDGTVSGTLKYAAVLPGAYSFDFSCLGSNSPDSPILVGGVITTNLGISDGNNNADSYNAITVFAENKSSTDTVIVFGAVGASKDALPPNPDSCIIYNPPTQNPTITRAVSISVYKQKRGDGQWYELGSLTFNLSASQISNGTPAYDAVFFYNCGGGKSPSDVITKGGGVVLH